MKKIKKSLLSTLLIFLLASCGNATMVNCYQCYFGSMYLSGARISYSEIHQKAIVNRAYEDKNNYFFNYYMVSNLNASEFLTNQAIYLPDEEIQNIQNLTEKTFYLYFFAQIPSGYKSFKRDNIQGYLIDETQVLITDNFYYYSDHTDILYCDIDIEKYDENTNETLFSFYFEIPTELASLISQNNIRALYKLKPNEKG